MDIDESLKDKLKAFDERMKKKQEEQDRAEAEEKAKLVNAYLKRRRG